MLRTRPDIPATPSPERPRPDWAYDLIFATLYVPIGLVPFVLVAWLRGRELSEAQELLLLAVSGASSFALLGVVYTLYQQKREIEGQNAILARMASTDPLTGLGNRRALWGYLERQVSLADGLPAVILALDLNGFKSLNDSLGHVEGDRALELVARTLRAATRGDRDGLFRVGGDEFVVVLPGTSAEDASLVARRLHETIASALHDRYGPESSGCAIGYAQRGDHETADAWLHRADLAMYAAKAGRSAPMLAPHHRPAAPVPERRRPSVS